MFIYSQILILLSPPPHVPHDGVPTPTSQAGVLSLGLGVEVGVCIAVRTTDNSQGDGQTSENDCTEKERTHVMG